MTGALEGMIMGFSIVASVFWIIWVIKYPDIIWDGICFRFDDGLIGHVVSVLIILFGLGFVYTAVTIAKLLVSL